MGGGGLEGGGVELAGAEMRDGIGDAIAKAEATLDDVSVAGEGVSVGDGIEGIADGGDLDGEGLVADLAYAGGFLGGGGFAHVAALLEARAARGPVVEAEGVEAGLHGASEVGGWSRKRFAIHPEKSRGGGAMRALQSFRGECDGRVAQATERKRPGDDVTGRRRGRDLRERRVNRTGRGRRPAKCFLADVENIVGMGAWPRKVRAHIEAELAILNVLWRRGPSIVREGCNEPGQKFG